MQHFYYGLFISVAFFSGLSASCAKTSASAYESTSSVAAVESFCHQFGMQSYYLKKLSQVYAFGGGQCILPEHCKLVPFFTISSTAIQKYLFSSMQRRLKLTDLWAALKIAAKHYSVKSQQVELLLTKLRCIILKAFTFKSEEKKNSLMDGHFATKDVPFGPEVTVDLNLFLRKIKPCLVAARPADLSWSKIAAVADSHSHPLLHAIGQALCQYFSSEALHKRFGSYLPKSFPDFPIVLHELPGEYLHGKMTHGHTPVTGCVEMIKSKQGVAEIKISATLGLSNELSAVDHFIVREEPFFTALPVCRLKSKRVVPMACELDKNYYDLVVEPIADQIMARKPVFNESIVRTLFKIAQSINARIADRSIVAFEYFIESPHLADYEVYVTGFMKNYEPAHESFGHMLKGADLLPIEQFSYDLTGQQLHSFVDRIFATVLKKRQKHGLEKGFELFRHHKAQDEALLCLLYEILSCIKSKEEYDALIHEMRPAEQSILDRFKLWIVEKYPRESLRYQAGEQLLIERIMISACKLEESVRFALSRDGKGFAGFSCEDLKSYCSELIGLYVEGFKNK